MEFIKTPFSGLYVIKHKILQDDRGLFSRLFCKNEFSKIGFGKEFIQSNYSFNLTKGTIRGMHFQISPYAEAKLIRCIQGAVYDVAIDIREGSPTYLEYFGIELTSINMYSVLIPEGFAHGFQTLEDNSALLYQHTQFYNAEADSGLRFDDPILNIEWKFPPKLVSPKDKSYKFINNNFNGIRI
jgi:dTDP-4-dehydrorhamnose 3,5-epimerase